MVLRLAVETEPRTVDFGLMALAAVATGAEAACVNMAAILVVEIAKTLSDKPVAKRSPRSRTKVLSFSGSIPTGFSGNHVHLLLAGGAGPIESRRLGFAIVESSPLKNLRILPDPKPRRPKKPHRNRLIILAW